MKPIWSKAELHPEVTLAASKHLISSLMNSLNVIYLEEQTASFVVIELSEIISQQPRDWLTDPPENSNILRLMSPTLIIWMSFR